MLSYPMYKDYQERNQVLDGLLCRRVEVVNLGFGATTERVEAELVSGNYFEVLGVEPALGRVFSMDDERAPGADAVVVLNYDYWRRRFAGYEGIVGESVRVNGHPMTVVGVAAPGFQGVSLGYSPKLHVPVTMKRQVTPWWHDLDNRRSRWVQVFARLRDGVSREQAEASIRVPHKQIITMEAEEPAFENVTPYWKEQFLRSYALSQRTKEIGIRVALGAKRSQVIRLVVRQGMLITAAGMAIGTVGAFALSRTTSSLLYGVDTTDPWVLGTASVALALVSLSAIGVPAWRAIQVDPIEILRHD